MKIKGLFNKKKPVLAFEIFPPKPDVPIESIFESLDQFQKLQPDYISVTFGAGGSAKDRTLEIANKIKDEYGIESMAHLTCVGSSEEEIDTILGQMHEMNLENILALRGDPPRDQPDFDFSKGVFRYANDLVKHIRKRNNFCVAAAAYMEGHQESRTLKEDLMYLKQKVDEGVDLLVTQFFFDNRLYYEFLDKAVGAGITCPIMPGIMPIFKPDQIKTMAAKSGCSFPARLVLIMDKFGHNADDMRKAGMEYAAEQIRGLVENEAVGIHLYTMNRPKATEEILKMAGMI